MSKEVNPRAVFDRLFGPAELTAEDRARRAADAGARAFWTSRPRTPPTCGASSTQSDGRKLDEYLYAVREIERRLQKAEAAAAACPPARGLPARPGVRRTRASDDGHDRAGLPDRFHADCHFHVRERREQPQLSRDRRAGRPSRVVAPRPRSGEAGEDQQDQPLSPWPAGRVSAEARRRQGRRRHACCRAR